MTTLRGIFMTAALFSVSGSGATAATISFSHVTADMDITTDTSEPTKKSPPPFAPFDHDIFTLPDFNTVMGTLTGVAITFEYDAIGELNVRKVSGKSQDFTNATLDVPLTLSGPDGLTVSGDAVSGPISGVAKSLSLRFPDLRITDTLTINVPFVDFAAFEVPPAAGADTFAVSGRIPLARAETSLGLVFSGIVGASGTSTITYTYDEPTVPEPAPMALMGGALLGFGLLRKSFAKS
jgi:hypothetical protein